MGREKIRLDRSLRADNPDDDAARDDGTHEVAPDVAYKRLGVVNVVFIGHPNAGDRGWVLLDAGLTKFSTGKIERLASRRFGSGNRPSSIVLTHGHFDHIGAARRLSQKWDCPIYAHPLEMPYLNGTSAYPSPDPRTGGGFTAWASGIFPRGPFNVGDRLIELPGDFSIPGLAGWRWIHVPGHSVGQIALWRESDRILLSADAVITTDQESAYAALTQRPELQGPPMYFTVDWILAKESVQVLADLEPHTILTGHGRAMAGPAIAEKLRYLADHFDSIAVPRKGKYVQNPARSEDGSAYRRK